MPKDAGYGQVVGGDRTARVETQAETTGAPVLEAEVPVKLDSPAAVPLADTAADEPQLQLVRIAILEIPRANGEFTRN